MVSFYRSFTPVYESEFEFHRPDGRTHEGLLRFADTHGCDL
ncbi:hypothetical protein OG799_14290 [Micromonospora sp. NBC_00898]|nr:hypothetical protein OG799_14290 [Micromonospora sp. NBC_00898]